MRVSTAMFYVTYTCHARVFYKKKKQKNKKYKTMKQCHPPILSSPAPLVIITTLGKIGFNLRGRETRGEQGLGEEG